jgi:hypothetical protein
MIKSSQVLSTASQTRKSPARRIGTPIPDSRPNRESGIPCFPAKIGNRGFPPRFPAKNRESGPIRGIRLPIMITE